MIDTIMMYIGYSVVWLAIAFTFAAGTCINRNEEGSSYKLFGFGLVILHTEKLINQVRALRKDDNAGISISYNAGIGIGKSVVLFDAPLWFNKYVYNFGTVK